MMEPKKREYLSAGKIHELYKHGRRDFSGVTCNNDSFDSFDLHEIVFIEANLDFCSFDGTNFSDSNFSGASLEWTRFTRANLRNANLSKVRAVWSVFNSAQFEKTNFRNADLSWSVFFDTNLYGGADLTGAITATIATDPSQITEEGLNKLAEKLGKMHGKVDPELMARLKLAAVTTEEKAKTSRDADDQKNVYEKGSSPYGTDKPATGVYTNSKNDNPYGSMPYKKKKKDKDIYDK